MFKWYDYLLMITYFKLYVRVKLYNYSTEVALLIEQIKCNLRMFLLDISANH